MHPNHLIFRSRVRSCLWNWAVGVVGFAIERSIPACLKSYVRLVHRDQIELSNGSFSPLIGSVIVDLLSNFVALIDIKDVPLVEISHSNMCTRSGSHSTVALLSIAYATADMGVAFRASVATMFELSPPCHDPSFMSCNLRISPPQCWKYTLIKP